jgi:hypothetical protein
MTYYKLLEAVPYIFAGVVVALMVYFILKKIKDDQEKKSWQEAQETRKKSLMTKLNRYLEDYVHELESFTKLSSAYNIENELKVAREHKRTIDELVRAGSVGEIESAMRICREQVVAIRRFRAKADDLFAWKYYDFLSGALLPDPVNLVINHPKYGAVILQANRENVSKYIDPQYGRQFFKLYPGRNLAQRYLVSARSPAVCERFIARHNDDFGVLSYADLYELICDNGNSCINDIGFPGGEAVRSFCRGKGCGFNFALRIPEPETDIATAMRQELKPVVEDRVGDHYGREVEVIGDKVDVLAAELVAQVKVKKTE